MRRFGQIGELKPEKKEQYLKLHENVWPEVLKTIKECNISNYSIFNFELFCFACFEYHGENYEEDMKKMKNNATVQRWWKHTKPCFKQFEFAGEDEYYIDMLEIFRMD